MGDFAFLQKLCDFDRDSITEESVDIIHSYSQLEEFHPDRMDQVSKAATCMCRWVLALGAYFNVMKMVRPREKALEVAEAELARKSQSLAESQVRLEALLQSVAQLQQSHQQMLVRKEQLNAEAARQASGTAGNGHTLSLASP